MISPLRLAPRIGENGCVVGRLGTFGTPVTPARSDVGSGLALNILLESSLLSPLDACDCSLVLDPSGGELGSVADRLDNLGMPVALVRMDEGLDVVPMFGSSGSFCVFLERTDNDDDDAGGLLSL